MSDDEDEYDEHTLTARRDAMQAALIIRSAWLASEPVRDVIIEATLGAVYGEHHFGGLCTLCAALIQSVTPEEVLGNPDATYTLGGVAAPPELDEQFPGLSDAVGQFWMAAVACDIDNLVALFKAQTFRDGDDAGRQRFGAYLTAIVGTACAADQVITIVKGSGPPVEMTDDLLARLVEEAGAE